jgi:uncharacterized DUF497 family protein
VDASYSFHGLDFEWDTRKASANLRKHRISFETAREVFLDPFVYIVETGVIEGEPREAAIGMTEDWRLLYVVYNLRDEVVRIISARSATNMERKLYETQ